MSVAGRSKILVASRSLSCNNATSPETVDLALKLADQFAVTSIECFGHEVGNRRYRNSLWFDVSSADRCPDEQNELDFSVRYLELRGLLYRFPGNPSLVRPAIPGSALNLELP